jgi:hypothetical protein
VFLKAFVGDWATKRLLQRQFCNKRGYEKAHKNANIAAAEALAGFDNGWEMGSNDGEQNE